MVENNQAFPANMAIKGRFVAALLTFLILSTSSASAPNAVASFWPEGIDAPGSMGEPSAVPQSTDDHFRPDVLVEQLLDGVGFDDEQGVATGEGKPAMDPWAEAFAESSRAAVVTVRAYPVAINPQVEHFLDRFTGARREVVSLWVGRAGRYLSMIRGVLKSRGLPEELAYTAMIESGFNPLAVSRAGAKGMWQFMAGTARRYGLRVDQWIDERLDPEKSTVAAAAYLHDLYGMFGSWALAQAAYNAGEMKVSRAIRATGSSDFWTLAQTNHLQTETKHFVPAIHAATLIALNPSRYGFQVKEDGPVAVETVVVPASTELRRLGPRAGITIETLKTLNPALVRGVTPPGKSWPLKVPAGTGADVQSALKPAAKRVATTTPQRDGTKQSVSANHGHSVHVVQPRDTVGAIAKKYGVTVADVLRWNSLEEQARIRPGDRLRIADVRTSLSDGQGGFR
jgi:membrane-bound lytic murein transglycosylase D